MNSERSGNSPRGRRGRRGSGGRPQQPGPGVNVRGDGQRRGRGTDERGARGNTGGRAGWKAGAPRPARSGAPTGGYQRRESGTSGWTTVRPWRPPRDDANEPILDDDTQPNWDQIAARTSPRRGTGTGQRPPAWPGNQQGGRRRGVVASRPPDRGGQGTPEQRAGGGKGPRKPASGGRRRRGTWMPPDTAANGK